MEPFLINTKNYHQSGIFDVILVKIIFTFFDVPHTLILAMKSMINIKIKIKQKYIKIQSIK
ncbi:hypothetical protein M998_3249 [Providencia heimbachae ATCC 35613]|uniref:Uncharacterized protein n=1 Tax=Providencia heimbachae ATCC 35613 TaxID=1354272 RepID=A0A1B7JLF7_9GAMM|nr:hypothetical protein M998_3249 [Providencia heimbachae ATCC 35613]